MISFLFTDIEGSTRLAQEFPDEYQDAMEKHYSIVKKTLESYNGFVFEIIGDAFCSSFNNASDAIIAAVNVQKNLCKKLTENISIKIRIGIHTGPADWDGKRYTGYITLARTARIMSVAYGEQIIISNETYNAVSDKQSRLLKDDGISFRDQGDRRLKDLIQPVHLFQVIGKGLREEFPPLQTLDARPNNIPVQLTSFIGKEKEIKLVKKQILKTRLLTLTGTGGSGKTRLALQIAADVIDDFANGVWLADLTSVSDQTSLLHALMKIFSLKEEPKKEPEETLIGYLKDKQILIILDNCEHLITECAELCERLISQCEKLRIIATSREALRCNGEKTYSVHPLETPDPKRKHTVDSLCGNEAVRLFVERGSTVNRDFVLSNDNAESIAKICHHLDGIPLAIELAAARVKFLSVEQILERLKDRFALLTGGKRTALPRQKTLRALIDWSYDLLSEEEKLLWRRLSVFNGGWTLESAEEICADEKIQRHAIIDLLGQLSEKSIIIFEPEIERYKILESLKQYGIEKFSDHEERDFIRTKHLEYFTKFTVDTETNSSEFDDEQWFEKLEHDQDNFQTAINWSIKTMNFESGAKQAAALGEFWGKRGNYKTGRKLYECFINNQNKVSRDSMKKVFSHCGSLLLFQGEFEKARMLFEKSFEISNENGADKNSFKALNGIGTIELYLGNFDKGRKLFEENLAIARKEKENTHIATSLNNLGNIEYSMGNFEKAKEFYTESLEYRRIIGSKHSIAVALGNLANISIDTGEYDLTKKYLDESLAISRETKNIRLTAHGLNVLGNLAYIKSDFEEAKKYAVEALELNRSMGDKRGIPRSLNNLAYIEYIKGNYEDARKYHQESLDMSIETDEKSGTAITLVSLGNIEYTLGNYRVARKNYEEALSINQKLGERITMIVALTGIAAILISEHKTEEGVLLLGASENAYKGLKKGIDYGQQKFIDLVKQKIDIKKFETEYEKGKSMKLEDIRLSDYGISV